MHKKNKTTHNTSVFVHFMNRRLYNSVKYKLITPSKYHTLHKFQEKQPKTDQKRLIFARVISPSNVNFHRKLKMLILSFPQVRFYGTFFCVYKWYNAID